MVHSVNSIFQWNLPYWSVDVYLCWLFLQLFHHLPSQAWKQNQVNVLEELLFPTCETFCENSLNTLIYKSRTSTFDLRIKALCQLSYLAPMWAVSLFCQYLYSVGFQSEAQNCNCHTNRDYTEVWHNVTPVCFVFERAKAPRQSLLGKGHPMRKMLISTEAFQWHSGGNCLCCLREVSGLQPGTSQ